MSTHRAAVFLSKGQPFEVQHRSTPKPGPGELLVAVKAVALNPADGLIRDLGLFVQNYPTVIGFDLAGVVLEVGEDVPTEGTKGLQGPIFQPGVTRVAAYAAFAWKGCHPDYGAFQERCIVPWQHAVPLLDDSLSWIEAATLPVAVQVPLMAWDAMQIPRIRTSPSAAPDQSFTNDGKNDSASREHNRYPREAVLIWGASSSVGTMGVQSARMLKDDTSSSIASVYTTAGSSNHTYVRSLGADRVFDHKDPQVVDAIVSTAMADGLVIRHCFLATGDFALCQKVLQSFVVEPVIDGEVFGTVASAPMLPATIDVVPGVKTIFIQPAMNDAERLAQFQFWMGTWLYEHLANGSIKPSPKPHVVGEGLSAINVGIDMLKQGVSCTKLVVQLDESVET